MKNLANCKPSEFIAQTVKIKKVVSVWLDEINFAEIKSREVELKTLPNPQIASAEERAEIIKENAALLKKKAMENASELFDNAFEKYPEDTIKVLALACFIEPADADNHTMAEYLGCFTEMMNCKEVKDFFILLASLKTAQTAI